MNLGLQMNVGLRMEQKLSPQMIQSLKLLQVNSLQLETLVRQEIEQNPVLELVEDIEENTEAREEKSGPDTPEKDLAEKEKKDEEINWEEYLNDGFDLGYRNTEAATGPEEVFERPPVYGRTLHESLLEQLNDRNLPDDIAEIVEYMINSLNDAGCLAPSSESDEKELPPEGGLLREVDDLIQGKLQLENASQILREAQHVLVSMDPPGIGARNLQECLLLQARRGNLLSPLAVRILEECWDLIERLKIAIMAKRLDSTPVEVQSALKEISRLDPHPGRQLEDSASGTVIPDLIVERVEGQLTAFLNDRTLPRLRISRAYTDLLKSGPARAKAGSKESEERKFIKNKLNSANWLIRSIDQRKSTMLKVMNTILEMQPEFFEKGPSFLRPLILQDIAEKIGMHISTVNRVTNGKYAQTEFGVFELKHFFSAGVVQEDGSEVSAAHTKAAICELIEQEVRSKPLSDQKIVEALKEKKDLKVARRTVAKYREQMNILPARMRKKY